MTARIRRRHVQEPASPAEPQPPASPAIPPADVSAGASEKEEAAPASHAVEPPSAVIPLFPERNPSARPHTARARRQPDFQLSLF